MRVVAFALVFAAVAVCATSGCGKKTVSEPVVAPAQSTPTGPPRTDGIYAAKVEAKGDEALAGGGGVDLLRFTKDGQVSSLSVASAGALEAAVKAILAGTDKAAKGPYELKDGVLRFTLTSKLGAVEYAGGLKGEDLVVRWRSGINEVSEEETFQFVKLADEDGKEPTETGEGKGEGDADAGPAATPTPAPGTTPPDPAFVPTGTAWACFRAPTMNTSRCERTMAACEQAYKEASAARSELKLSKCAKRPNAFCHTVQRHTSGRGSGFCYQIEEECKAGAAGFEGPDLVISSCGKF